MQHNAVDFLEAVHSPERVEIGHAVPPLSGNLIEGSYSRSVLSDGRYLSRVSGSDLSGQTRCQTGPQTAAGHCLSQNVQASNYTRILASGVKLLHCYCPAMALLFSTLSISDLFNKFSNSSNVTRVQSGRLGRGHTFNWFIRRQI